MGERRQFSFIRRDGALTFDERHRLEWSINMPKGLHKKSVGRKINLGDGDRLLLLGTQEIPLGSEINVGADAEMAVV